MTDFTLEELASCDYTEVRFDAEGNVAHYSAKTGKLLTEPLPSPAAQILAKRAAAK